MTVKALFSYNACASIAVDPRTKENYESENFIGEGPRRMEINGVAHIHLTVNNLERAMPFYEKVLGFFGLMPVVKSSKGLYCIGGKTAVAMTRSSRDNRDISFDQRRIGLHHICFRARERADVDAAYEFLKSIGAKIVHPPEEGPWFPGYYSLLFEDPEGIRLELNHVPMKGFLGDADQKDPFAGNLPLDHFPGYEDYPKK